MCTTDAIINTFRNGDLEKSITISRLFEIHNEGIRKKAEQRLISISVLQKYEKTKQNVIDYIREELKRDDILIQEITPNFIGYNGQVHEW